jgi:hypothetical protein
MLKSELQKYAAPVLDDDFCDIVISAVRYALPRHSYMPSLTIDYVWHHWPLLGQKHWCILRDIREHFRDTLRLWENHPEWKENIDVSDLTAWVEFYNKLINRTDTNWPYGERQAHSPLPLPDTIIYVQKLHHNS